MPTRRIVTDNLSGVRAVLVAALILLFPVATLLVDSAATVSLLLLALLGVLFTVTERAPQTPLSRDEKLLIFSAVFFVAIAVVAYFANDITYLGFKKLGRYLRFLLLVPIYLVMRRMPHSEGVWWTGLALGGISAGMFCLSAVLAGEGEDLFGMDDDGVTSIVLFGDLSLVMAFMCLGGFGYFRERSPWLVALPVAGFVFGFFAAFVSGARGAWLAMPLLVLLMFWYFARERGVRERMLMLGGILLFALAVYLVPQSGVAERVASLFEDLRLVMSGVATDGPFGLRLAMWPIALDAFLQNPVLGTGVGGFAQVLREWVEAGIAPEYLLRFDHPHNEFLSVLSTRGLFGLTALLLVLGIPLAHFLWGVRHADRRISGLSYAGMVLIAGFVQFGMTEAIFERTMPITFYVFCLAVIYGLVRANERAFLAQTFTRNRTLSVIVITLNEADRIRPCLESVHGWADEIIVLDSGSTDGTVDIVREYTDKVWVTDWPGFGRQKQRALDHATGEWVLSIDADERVTSELRAEIDHTLSGIPANTGYDVHRPVVLFGRIMDFSGSGQSPLRLFRRSEAAFTLVPVHERVDLKSGTLGRLRGALYHETYRDYNHAVAKFGEYAWLQANERYRNGKRSGLFSAALRGVLNFLHNYFIRLGFLDGSRGFILAALHANYTFNKYAALWEIELRESHKRRDNGERSEDATRVHERREG